MYHLLDYIMPCTQREERYPLWSPHPISSGSTPPRWSPSSDSRQPRTQICLAEKHQRLTTSWHLCQSWSRQKHQQKSCLNNEEAFSSQNTQKKEFSEPPTEVQPMTYQIPVGRSNHYAMGDLWWARSYTRFLYVWHVSCHSARLNVSKW